jgi:hypothetical protein
MNIRYRVELSEAERCELQAMLKGGQHAARKLKRAQILLAADAGVRDDDIAASVVVGGSTVFRTKRRFVRQPGTGAQRGAAPGRSPQAHRSAGGTAGGNRLLEPACGPRPLDP